jgi:triosephosphate isomerase (TIM)
MDFMKKRTPVIGGNWKMYKDPTGTTSFFESFRPLVERSGRCEIVICPSFLDVEAAVTATRGTRIQIGAQNLYWAKEGAFTGEVSGPMIRASGCSHVIVGHSERRQYFGETNESVLKKTVAALDAGLIPIVCVGEREKRNVEEVLKEQFRNGIGALSVGQFCKNRNRLRTCLGDRRRRDRRAGCRRRCSPAHPRAGEAPVRSRGCEQCPHLIRRQR